MSRKFFAVSADGPWISTATLGVPHAGNQGTLGLPGPARSFPHSILLPRFSREPYRLDMGIHPHPRGSGQSWPPEAIADARSGVGRLPVGLILERIEANKRPFWTSADPQHFDPAEAIASVIGQLCSDGGVEEEVVFPIPNTWGETLQQRMIDAFQMQNVKCKLLWRPIAAALEWLARFESELNSPAPFTEHQTVGQLLAIYVGYDHIEVTALDLVQTMDDQARPCIVPGRRRPQKQERLPGFGYRLAIHSLCREAKRQATFEPTSAENFNHVWNRLWCSPALTRFQSEPVSTTDVPGGEIESTICGMPQLSLDGLKWRLRELQLGLADTYTGVVFTGPLANVTLESSQNLWQWVLSNLSISCQRTLIEGQDADPGLLARGASRFASKIEDGLPTYLDTLPLLQMVISENGEPTWIDLLEPEHKWVDGGRVWQRPERISNLAISANSVELKLAIAHEEFDHVREVVTEIPNSSKQRENFSLSVRMSPAQGKARLEIHPEKEGLFDGKRVFIDWRSMAEFRDKNGQSVDKDRYLVNLPRILPPLLPRVWSASKWRSVQPWMNELRELMRADADPAVVESTLENTRALLREKDQSKYPQDATAFDSEGRCSGNYDLGAFMKIAWPYFVKHRPKQFMRAIAYTHVDHKALQKHITEALLTGFPRDDYVVAAGKCLRDPEHIDVFIQAVILQSKVQRLTAEWWRALSEVLRFRADATKNVSSEHCSRVVELAIAQFERERRRRSGQELFRLVCLVIVYALRRRAFEDAFLDPESELARHVKNEFRKAQDDAKAHRLKLMGGAVDLPGQLQLIIDYVDRQGIGTPVAR